MCIKRAARLLNIASTIRKRPSYRFSKNSGRVDIFVRRKNGTNKNARISNSKAENHSKLPQTIPSIKPDSESPTRWTVEILEAKREAPITPQVSDLLAKKYPSLVLFFLLPYQRPSTTMPTKYTVVIMISRLERLSIH